MNAPFNHQHRIGLTRREILQTGYSGLLGLGLPAVLAGRTRMARANEAGRGRARARCDGDADRRAQQA
ncbi:MAG: hypothetical protein V4719_13405, partial [Planctomycetota bacterium]